jgi:hypothetical protein
MDSFNLSSPANVRLSTTRVACTGVNEFAWCHDLREGRFPTLTTLEESGFCFSGVMTVRLGACCGLTETRPPVWQHCRKRTSLELPISVRKIVSGFVIQCPSIDELELSSPGSASSQRAHSYAIERVILRGADCRSLGVSWRDPISRLRIRVLADLVLRTQAALAATLRLPHPKVQGTAGVNGRPRIRALRPGTRLAQARARVIPIAGDG